MTAGKLKIGLLGLGRWGWNLARAFHASRSAETALACDVVPSLIVAAREAGLAQSFSSDCSDVFRDRTIDAVVVATPPHTHYELARAAVEARKHVFVEKPMTLSLAQAVQLRSAARVAGVKVMVGHVLNYHPGVLELARLAREGELGELRLVASRRLTTSTKPRVENAWWTLAPHDFSVLEMLLGPDALSLVVQQQTVSGRAREEEFLARVNYPHDRRALIHVSTAHDKKVRWLALVGARRMALFDDVAQPFRITLYGVPRSSAELGWASVERIASTRPLQVLEYARTEPLALEIQHFIDFITRGVECRTDIDHGVRIVRLLESGTASLQKNAPLELVRSPEAHLVLGAVP